MKMIIFRKYIAFDKLFLFSLQFIQALSTIYILLVRFNRNSIRSHYLQPDYLKWGYLLAWDIENKKNKEIKKYF